MRPSQDSISTLGSSLLASDKFSKPKTLILDFLIPGWSVLNCHSGKTVGLIKDSSNFMEVPDSHSELFCGKEAPQNSRIPGNSFFLKFKKKTTKTRTQNPIVSAGIQSLLLVTALNMYAILKHKVMSGCTCTSFRANKRQKKTPSALLFKKIKESDDRNYKLQRSPKRLTITKTISKFK